MKPGHFPVYITEPGFFLVWGMETGICPVYRMRPGHFSGLRNKALNFC